ncbi:hypothetical protein KIW84_011192 [Lathyrus oleraceus]|uniref:Uncharacterized protein n=1 Tax=Pisum sativum TaxID=3888 RepID=A0A9D4YLY4_PEA|nr:hypothetical protein KIW84_011192 [Pisum sativum]
MLPTVPHSELRFSSYGKNKNEAFFLRAVMLARRNGCELWRYKSVEKHFVLAQRRPNEPISPRARLASTGHKEEDVILEPYFETERANTVTMSGSFDPYFYLHLPIIHELGLLIPFTPFESDFLTTINVVPSQVMPNVEADLEKLENVELEEQLLQPAIIATAATTYVPFGRQIVPSKLTLEEDELVALHVGMTL